jgi:catechol 2,3-dioxygenase-like lactoylglutathione lyase family enzyme
MKNMLLLASVALVFGFFGFQLATKLPVSPTHKMEDPLRLGAFSVSLNVKDLAASKAFYEQMGFRVHGGDEKANYVIMRNGDALIGLFQGYFEGNILTFNPGWDIDKKNLEDFDDVRVIHEKLKKDGVDFTSEGIEGEKGPSYFTFNDPDGNQILIDQHR